MQDDQSTTDTTPAATAADDGAPAAKTPRKRTPRKNVADTAVATPDVDASTAAAAAGSDDAGTADAAPVKAARKRTPRKKVADVPAPVVTEAADPDGDAAAVAAAELAAAELAAAEAAKPAKRTRKAPPAVTFQPPAAVFQPPSVEVADAPADDEPAPAPRTRTRRPRMVVADDATATPDADAPTAATDDADASAAADVESTGDDADDDSAASRRRRRGRRGRGRRGEPGEAADPSADPAAATAADSAEPAAAGAPADDADDDSEEARGTRRRRRRRRGGGGDEPAPDDPPRTVTRVREPRTTGGGGGNEVRGLSGSTRLEAKKIRRREGREQSRRRPPVITESEFLARRESVDRIMLVQQYDDRTQIAVLEDGVLVEHYVTKAQATSYAGNVYLGRVQNVLPSMEAAFVDIGKGRNAVLYAGEVNYDTSALEGRAPRIEQALKSGQEIVAQVTKDPIGQKGARLTSQVSLPGRYMVYVPEGSMTGISRKLPDTERTRLKGILKTLKPDGAGIIVRTAAEGASEEDLTADLDRLKAQWESIEKAAKKGKAPALLHGEPDLVIRVIRDNFNEDFAQLVVSGAGDYDTIHDYLEYLAPDLMPRLQKWVEPTPLFDHHRVNEQLLKAMDRKVWLPSGGSLVIDRTEAMTVVDVNTGKFTGKGGNLEETVTKNNLEAAEEIVRQLRLRDIGGIIVVDFIDMVLESNRELVMRRLKECLGRDRTKHQVAEVTSLGLVQMTRKRISQGLIEAFSETCEHCNGRGIKVHTDMLGGTAGGSRRSDAAKPRPIPKPIPRPPALVPAAATGNGAGPAPAAAVGVPDGPGVDGGALAGPGEVPAAPDGAAPDATAADPTSVDGAASVTGAADDEGTGRGRRSRGGRSRRGRGGGDAAVAGDGAPGEAAAAPADGDPVETAAAPAVRGPNARAARTPVLPKVSRVIDDTEDDWAWAAGPVQEPAQDEAPVMAEAIGDAADGAAADGDAAAEESTPKKPARRRGGRGRGKAAAVGAGTDS